MNDWSKRDDDAQLPATRPQTPLGLRFLGWFLLTSSLGLVSCQSLFFI